MAKGATLSEVKKAKVALEADILSKLKEFEKEYGVKLEYISIHRKNENEVVGRPDEPYSGPPVNVDVRMELDWE